MIRPIDAMFQASRNFSGTNVNAFIGDDSPPEAQEAIEKADFIIVRDVTTQMQSVVYGNLPLILKQKASPNDRHSANVMVVEFDLWSGELQQFLNRVVEKRGEHCFQGQLH